jgi:hypothetical protein
MHFNVSRPFWCVLEMTIPCVIFYIYISFIDRTISNVIEISQNVFYGHSVFQSPTRLLSICTAFDVFSECCHGQGRQKEFSQSMTYFIQWRGETPIWLLWMIWNFREIWTHFNNRTTLAIHSHIVVISVWQCVLLLAHTDISKERTASVFFLSKIGDEVRRALAVKFEKLKPHVPSTS